jgi:general secretion pathway protein M
MTLRERYDKLEPRERRLLTILIGVFGTMVFLVLPIGLLGLLSSKRSANQEVRDLIQSIQDNRVQVSERKAKHDALIARYAKQAPALGGFIEEAAKANGLASPESQDRPEVPHGKRYTEKVTVVKLHKVGMLALTKTLEKIEQSGYPVAVTRLNIKPRSGEPDSYEVELGVSAFDRKPDAAPSASPSASASASAGKDAPKDELP